MHRLRVFAIAERLGASSTSGIVLEVPWTLQAKVDTL